MRHEARAVVVVGAGPAGLVTAVVLARQGIDVLVLERRPEPSHAPRAVGITLRQMELMRAWGLEERVLAGAADVALAVLDTETLASAGRGTVRDVGLPHRDQAAVVSPSYPARVPQDHLERVLLEHLDELGTAEVRRGVEVSAADQGEDAVRLTTSAGDVTAQYVVAADGARSGLRAALGIEMVGPEDMMAGFGVEIRADLWPVVGEHRYALYSIDGPEARGVLIPAGGDRWQFGVVLTEDDDPDLLADHGALRARIRSAVGVEDLEVEIVRDNSFRSGAQLATRFSEGRVFLVGDAAHRVTPRGGNGLAMAVRNGLDLGWRLSWVLRGWAPASFLGTYEVECRPVAADSVARAADPEGFCRSVIAEMQLDLGGRLTHAWLAPGLSTLDLVGPALTLLVTEDDADWRGAVTWARTPVPIEVAALPPLTAHALGLHRGAGALLVRPDGVPVASWWSSDDHVRALETAVAALFSVQQRGIEESGAEGAGQPGGEIGFGPAVVEQEPARLG